VWAKDHSYRRGLLIGQGLFINAIEGSLRQTRRALAPLLAGNLASGVILFSMATPDAAIASNPWATSTSELWPPNGGTVTIGISGQAADVGTGLARIAVRVVDEYGDVEPTVPPIEVASAGAHAWEVSVPLVAARLDTDKDVGRTRLR
jgi:hypothetical protein